MEIPNQGYEGYGRTWDIEVPNREGRVRLSYGLELFLLDFPGGFGWTEIADFTGDDHHDALHALLQLLDSYADPGTRLVPTQRRWRRPRLELHFTDGTVLWRRGGQRPRS